jgi:hypothetical protein
MPEESTTTTSTTENTKNAQSETPASFESWLETQDEQVKGLYEQHTSGLKNAVKATRDERDALAREIKDLMPKAEKGSELEQKLTLTLERLEQAEKRSLFLESAAAPEIGCSNPKAAWLIAQADELFDRRGNPDWAAIKAAAPELFGKRVVQAHGGAGTETLPAATSMNNYIRRAAGRE